ncbi:Pentatricopeptide repeat domain containing protein [Dorcoceras hygrometricum]|uniref:Pentatricopeptide repeat domain containing protein n=1 Tax=Dorcoceras hygrometricum TaxID=472368 RepID=A0A2Z7AU14_9LAMI|nr:Pentatricopeptide repeat domain containing protein [Dorcoceras hygrometricum]
MKSIKCINVVLWILGRYKICFFVQTTEDEVFDISNSEFTREDVINTLKEMVHEYRKLSQTFEEIKAENGCKLHETHKPLNDKSGLGFSFGEISSEGMSTQSDLAGDKFKKMNFVKASVIHDVCESVKYDDQISRQLKHKGKSGYHGFSAGRGVDPAGSAPGGG